MRRPWPGRLTWPFGQPSPGAWAPRPLPRGAKVSKRSKLAIGISRTDTSLPVFDQHQLRDRPEAQNHDAPSVVEAALATAILLQRKLDANLHTRTVLQIPCQSVRTVKPGDQAHDVKPQAEMGVLLILFLAHRDHRLEQPVLHVRGQRWSRIRH